MKVSYRWLKQYVNIDIDPAELADQLTMAGLAVEHVEFLNGGIKNVVVGEILEIKEHPQADKLVICQVNVGKETVQIVTGASNVKTGQKIPVAVVGAELPGGVKIKKARLRGIDSFGMMCSARELNIDEFFVSEESREGILILHPDTPAGEDAVQVLGLDDAVLEFELTPNRSDCLSVINIAREVATVTGCDLRMPEINFEETKEEINGVAAVEVKDPDLCHRYVVRVVKDVKIGPSPEWMQHFLRSAGVRPINNVVDVSNFVMLEMGQPLHTFDYDLITGHRIIVRRAQEGEKMVTLDEQERVFNCDTLLICDEEKPITVAGVMGGLETEVALETTNILIEAAWFHPVSIRRTSRMLGLRSESSLRFEKGLDVHNVVNSCNRAAQLLAELAGGRVVKGVIDTFQGKAEPVVIKLRTQKVNDILGIGISTEEIANFMTRLHFPVQVKDNEMNVTIPSYRQDITREIDLVEEVARLKGYDKIPVTLPFGSMTEGKRTEMQSLEDRVKELLIGMGLTEVISYSFISPRDLDKINLPAEAELRKVVKIQNPLSDEQSIMRTTLIPGLLGTAALNVSRRNTDLAIFEMGRVFLPGNEKLPHEVKTVAAMALGKINRGWKWEPQELDFYYLKGVLEELFRRLGINNWQLKAESLPPFLHPGRAGRIFINEVNVGYLGEVHPKVQENYDLEKKAVVFQLEMNPLLEAVSGQVHCARVGKFPAVQRDMALVVPDSVTARLVNDVIWANGGEILTGVDLFDIYQGNQIPQGFKSLAYSLSFQAADHTLTDEEVVQVFEKIKKRLFEELGVELR